MMSIFVCPVCHSPLRQESSRYVCANNHAFDIARQGYVNLLLANQKRSRQPGDSAEMIRSRRLFLEGGFYDPLRDLLSSLVSQRVEKPAGTALDVGCGEGFYIGNIQAGQRYGIDISTSAVRLAARRYPEVRFAVAGMKHLPISDQQVDCLLSVFAPRSFSEFARVLHPAGSLIAVTPGPEHLWGLRRLLYADPKPHRDEVPAPDGFELVADHRLHYGIELHSKESISHLLAMTPYVWQAPQTALEVAMNLDNLQTPVDFCVRVYSKTVSSTS